MKKTFVAIGHIDAGKSCLCGRLLYDCGEVDEHSMSKINKKAMKDKIGSWNWSRILDIYEEEMARGKTHKMSSVKFTYNQRKYELIDTPGHGCFVRSMIEGISGDVNIAVVLISMKENEFNAGFKGMLTEHLFLVRAMGIKYIVVLGNKMDLIKWNEALYNERINKVINFLKNDLKWKTRNIRHIPICACKGIGLINRKGYPDWYDGKSFIETIDDLPNAANVILDESKVSDMQIFDVKLKIYNTEDSVITSGYVCNIHFKGKDKEEEIEIIQIKGGKKIMRKDDMAICTIKLENSTKIYHNLIIILRKNNYTVGFGKIKLN